MRELTAIEMGFVSGAGEECPEGEGEGDGGGDGNDIGGIKKSDEFGDDVVNIYEGLIQAMSHAIERVASAIKN